MKIGISGGTFDPVHYGHLLPLKHAAGVIGWDRIELMPANRQPFKIDRKIASPFDRHAMLALATAGHDLFRISNLELEREGVSYTVDTLESISSNVGSDTRIDWVIGDDNLEKLHQWKRFDRILELANFVVLKRGRAVDGVPGDLAERIVSVEDAGKAGGVILIDNETIEISSTEIRRRVGSGEPIENLVPDQVGEYVRKYGLYR